MIYRIFAMKDTFITNERYGSLPQTGSNFGACEILHLHKKVGNSGSVGWAASSSLSRILTKFDLTQVSSLLSSKSIPSSSVKYFLHLSDARHDQTLPTSYDVEIQALTQDWDEGRGFDVDTFADKGFANWDKAKSTVSWDVTGSQGTGSISTFHFDTGHEDIECDVTNIVMGWLTGSVINNGMLVKMSAVHESDSSDYYIKMFHSKQTFFKDKRPYLEARFDDSIKDDRNNFFFDIEGNLFIRNIVKGNLQNIPAIGTGSIGVRISDASGTILTVTGSYAGQTGLYSATLTIPSGNYSGSIFFDSWFDLNSTGSVLFTGSFNPKTQSPESSNTDKRYFCNIVNLKNSYYTNEIPKLKLFVRPHDYNPARVLTASLDSSGQVINTAYYSVSNERTGDVVIPWGTGSQQETRLSYDKNGNYFVLPMMNFSPGNVYRISILFDVDGQTQIVNDNSFKFRVV